MDTYIIDLFKLEPHPDYVTPIDKFKLFRNFDGFISALKDYASKNKLTDFEQFYFDIQTDPRRKFFHQISQTYFENYFLDIYFILSNPVLINDRTMHNLYRERNLLPEITDHIINLYENMDSETSRFFNKTLLDQFISNLDFIPLPDDQTNQEYQNYFQLFSNETTRLKAFLTELIKNPKWIQHPQQGLSEFDPKYFQYAFQYNTGIKLKSPNDFIQIKRWAQKHLDHLMDEINKTSERLLTTEEDKLKTAHEKMFLLGNHITQQWSSKQEMKEAHEQCIMKYRDKFITRYGFREHVQPNIVTLDNPLLAGGYYYKGCFYLNVYHWSNGNYKYEVENLTLHEAIPGHHLQLDISVHSSKLNRLALYDYPPCNGFVEGWALFAEHLGDNMLDDPWTYFGYLQSNILRTFRIIAEILLHVEGTTPDDVIQLAKKYLTTSEESIKSEIYRYRVLPGQASSYKTGLEVFRRIIKEKFQVTNMKDFLRDDIVRWYKATLDETERPLELLLQENNIQWTFDI